VTPNEPLRNPQTLAEIDSDGGPLDGFQEFLLELWHELIDLRKPVAHVHGDSYYLRTDKSFLDSQGRHLKNFTRVEAFGDNAGNGINDVNWLMVFVHSRSREVFSSQPEIVPANRVAVPAA
jgi:hypothetical protein